MSYNIVTIPPFDRQLKRLAKKYSSLKEDYRLLLEMLEANPDTGTSLGNSCYKIRLAITSKGKGKSGGARVITYVQVFNNTVFLLSIFDKSEHESISENELNDLLTFIP